MAISFGFNGGLARYVDGAFTFYATQDGLPAGAILAMHVDRSKRLWLASEHSGLIRVDADRADSPSFVAYTTAEGLSSNNINVLAEDRDGSLVLMKTTEAVALWELATCLRTGLPTIHQAMAMDGGASSDLLVEGTLPGEAEHGTALSVQSFQDLVDGGGMRHIPLPAVIGVSPRAADPAVLNR